MTILMTVFGTIVFIVSLFTTTFAVAFKRLWMFTLTGLIIDSLIIAIATAAFYLV